MEWLIVALLVANFGLMAFFLWRRQPKEDDRGLMLLQNQLQDLARTMEHKLGEGTTRMFESMRTQFGESQRLATDIRDLVHKQLTEVARGVAETKESTKQVFTLADQLQNLERVLKNQKQRGNLGEAGLELVLSNILPPDRYKIQYEFPGGDTVDAAIFVKEGIIPVDAKFPLENYMRILDEKDDERRDTYVDAFKKDLKKRIDETSKYIRPQDGTLSFAFMYIPAESIYYDVVTGSVGAINARSLLDYAQNEKNVIIVSPTTFFAYLQSVLYGFKAFKIEKDAEQIKKNVEVLMKHVAAYDVYYKKLGSALSTTVNHYNSGTKELGKIDKDVLKITGENVGLDVALLEKPQEED
jgi:DNA recombination protein RmuC